MPESMWAGSHPGSKLLCIAALRCAMQPERIVISAGVVARPGRVHGPGVSVAVPWLSRTVLPTNHIPTCRQPVPMSHDAIFVSYGCALLLVGIRWASAGGGLLLVQADCSWWKSSICQPMVHCPRRKSDLCRRRVH